MVAVSAVGLVCGGELRRSEGLLGPCTPPLPGPLISLI